MSFKNILFITLTILSSAEYSAGISKYIVTSPRRWTSGASAQVCVALLGDRGLNDHLNITVKSNDNKEDIVPRQTFNIPLVSSENCYKVRVPHVRQSEGTIQVEGQLSNETYSHTGYITITKDAVKTFISTDKYLYKPGQMVKFRILTVAGPYLQVSTESYNEVYVENPQNTRIAQWKEIDNPGLIHLEFLLSDEPEQGTYKIKVKSNRDRISERLFKVEEFVLPRYEVSIKPPAYILGTHKSFNFTVCAKYTYGESVKGKVKLYIGNNGFMKNNITIVKSGDIKGCKEFEVNSTELDLNGEYFAYRVHAAATVIEDGTDIEMDAKALDVEVSRTALKFTNIGQESYYKPNLPYTGKFKVTYPDNTPAPNEKLLVCAGSACMKFTTSAEGTLEFIIPPHIRDNIKITSIDHPSLKGERPWKSVMYDSSLHQRMKKYFSPSNSSLSVLPKLRQQRCLSGQNIEFILPVLYSLSNHSKVKLNVMVISRGQVQFMKTKVYSLSPNSINIDESISIEKMKPTKLDEGSVGTLEMEVSLRTTVSPNAKVLAWIVRDDGEVVSDVTIVKVKKCLENNVGLSWSKGILEPGEKTTMKLVAEPKSICSIGVVDRSVELLSLQNEPLSIEKIFEVVKNAEVTERENSQIDDYEYCYKKDKKEKSSRPSWGMNDPFTDERLAGGQISDITGAVPESDSEDPLTLTRTKRSFMPYISNNVDAIHMFDASGLNVFTTLTIETRPCPELREMFPLSALHYSSRVKSRRLSKIVRVQSSPQMSLVAMHAKAPPSVKAPVQITPVIELETERSYFPETLLWEIFSLDDSGVDQQQVTIPDTITEWIGRAVCVHPSKGVGLSEESPVITFTPFFIDLTLPSTVKRGEVFPVKISVFNYKDDYLPIKINFHTSEEYDIIDKSTKTVNNSDLIGTKCIPPQDKHVFTYHITSKVIGDVNLTIEATPDYSLVCPNLINSTHANKSDVIIKSVKSEAEGFPREKTWTKYICEKEIQENIDFLSEWHLSLPEEYVLDSERGWVTVVGDLLGPTIDNLGHLVRLPTGCGEQNMLNFAPNIFVMQYLDASNQTTEDIAAKSIGYMQTGYQRELNYRHADGSYSAFGKNDKEGSTWLTAFVVKSFAQARPYINIDSDDLLMSIKWLKDQQLENGCFKSVGKVLHQGLKGGAANSASPGVLSAYVLISLIEAGEAPGSVPISDSIFCLRAHKAEDPYSLALKAYAYSLANRPDARDVLNQLISLGSSTSSTLHWEKENDSALAVEIAGYAVLAMMSYSQSSSKVNFEAEARKVIKWISAQQNGQGGFVSTQDTVVALQALSVYEAAQPDQHLDLKMMVNTDGLEHVFHVKEDNKLLQQTVSLPRLPTSVLLDLAGDGCALVQAVLRYNVLNPDPSETFELNVTAVTYPDKGCKTKRIQACFSYLLPKKSSNMAVLEVGLTSGYIPHKPDLKGLVGPEKTLKRYEVDGNKVNLYVEEIAEGATMCASFNVIREVLVENPKPATVKFYDYYRPEHSINKKYSLPPADDCIDPPLALPLPSHRRILPRSVPIDQW